MSAAYPVSDMMVTVKSREIQRGMLAEFAGDMAGAARHNLAAAYLELVLATDYDQIGETRMATRSRISAASCLWRAGRVSEARDLFSDLEANHPERAQEIRKVVADLETDGSASLGA